MVKPKHTEEDAASFANKALDYWSKAKLDKVVGRKKLIVYPHEASWLLRNLGLLNSDASMSADSVRKFLQINHLLHLIKTNLDNLADRFPTVFIADLCCGKSYLAFLTVWYLKQIKKKNVRVLAIDQNSKIMDQMRIMATKLSFDEDIKFKSSALTGADINHELVEAFALDSADRKNRLHYVFALHACDTATDYVIASAIRSKSEFIAVAPCCQAQLAQYWQSNASIDNGHPLAPIAHNAHFRREMAADFTDVLRMLCMRSHGYEVTATEFTAPEHTAKNRMLTAIRRGAYLKSAQEEHQRLLTSIGNPDLTLSNLMSESLRV